MIRLRRVTSGGGWIPQIDGLRFVAIATVVFLHATLLVQAGRNGVLVSPHWSRSLLAVVDNFDRGVLLFFVISGYILAKPFLKQHLLSGRKVEIQAYYLRRLTRLEPPYLICLLLYCGAYHYGFHRSSASLLTHFLASLAYSHELIYQAKSTINAVTWSLEAEVQFYLLAPWLCLPLAIRNKDFRRMLLIVLIVATASASNFLTPHFHRTLAGFIHYFLAGILLADVLEYPAHGIPSHWAWDIVSLLGWPLLFLPRGTHVTEVWMPFLIILLCLAAFGGPWSTAFLKNSFVSITGGMCYSIYLMHILFFQALYQVVQHVNSRSVWVTMAFQIAALVLGSAPFCVLFFILVERPCMNPRWPQDLLKRFQLLTSRTAL